MVEVVLKSLEEIEKTGIYKSGIDSCVFWHKCRNKKFKIKSIEKKREMKYDTDTFFVCEVVNGDAPFNYWVPFDWIKIPLAQIELDFGEENGI